MNLNLTLDPARELAETKEVLGDVRGILKLRMKRPDVTAARIVVIGKLLNLMDEVEAKASQPEGLAA